MATPFDTFANDITFTHGYDAILDNSLQALVSPPAAGNNSQAEVRDHYAHLFLLAIFMPYTCRFQLIILSNLTNAVTIQHKATTDSIVRTTGLFTGMEDLFYYTTWLGTYHPHLRSSKHGFNSVDFHQAYHYRRLEPFRHEEGGFCRCPDPEFPFGDSRGTVIFIG